MWKKNVFKQYIRYSLYFQANVQKSFNKTPRWNTKHVPVRADAYRAEDRLWRSSCHEFCTGAAVCNHWPFLIILFIPHSKQAAGAAFQPCLFLLQLTQGTARELCWARERCLPALSKAGLPAQTYTAKDLTLLGKRLNKNDGFESQHTFGCVIQNAQPGLSPRQHQWHFCPWCLTGAKQLGQGLQCCPGPGPGMAVRGELCPALHTRLLCPSRCQVLPTCSSHFGNNLESVE